MSFTIDIQVNNIAEALAELELKKNIVLEICGSKIENYAADLAPVGTPETTGIPGYKGGSLRSTIRHEMEDSDTVAIKAGGIRGIYRDVNYAVYVEMGTRKMKAQPYLRPAVENHLSEIKDIIESELKG